MTVGSAAIAPAGSFAEFCVCPACTSTLVDGEEGLECRACARTYSVRDNVAILLTEYEDDLHERYFSTYEDIARRDLQDPLEVPAVRAARHRDLVRFIGNVRGKRVLGIGSSNALYLRTMKADTRVAFDIAFPYLAQVPQQPGLHRVCGDAEVLPFRAGYFDVIVISDVLEHVLDPGRLVDRIAAIARPDTRVIVDVPWEEDLSSYLNQEWEFTHLRSFDLFSFSSLWSQFEIRRMRDSVRRHDQPLFFSDHARLPRPIFNLLRFAYHQGALAVFEARWREARQQSPESPGGFLDRFSKPLLRQFELRLFPTGYGRMYAAVERAARTLRPVVGRMRRFSSAAARRRA